MQEFIVNLNTKINPTKYLTGSCAAYAAVLCEEAERRGLSWSFEVLLRTDDGGEKGEFLVSHVLAAIDGKYYDVGGKTDPDYWIDDINKDLEVITGSQLEWRQENYGGGWPSLVLKDISDKYHFDHDQLSSYSELSKIAKEVHDAALSKDNPE